MIVGVNKYQPEKSADGQPEVQVLVIDNEQVRTSQIAKMAEMKKRRDAAQVAAALDALTAAAADPAAGNLLQLAVNAARVRCTVGEISDAMEKVTSATHCCHLLP